MKKITLLITTYNRKDRLCQMLKSIERQGHYDEYEMVICDNHSDYNVENYVSSNFNNEFVSNIKFNTWRFNTGQSTNMAIAFLLVETKWCWYLSDDDEITEGALEHVLKDVEVYPNVAAIKHSLQGVFVHNDRKLCNTTDLVDYYKGKNKGELIFLSMVYNLEILKPLCLALDMLQNIMLYINI